MQRPTGHVISTREAQLHDCKSRGRGDAVDHTLHTTAGAAELCGSSPPSGTSLLLQVSLTTEGEETFIWVSATFA